MDHIDSVIEETNYYRQTLLHISLAADSSYVVCILNNGFKVH